MISGRKEQAKGPKPFSWWWWICIGRLHTNEFASLWKGIHSKKLAFKIHSVEFNRQANITWFSLGRNNRFNCIPPGWNYFLQYFNIFFPYENQLQMKGYLPMYNLLHYHICLNIGYYKEFLKNDAINFGANSSFQQKQKNYIDI